MRKNVIQHENVLSKVKNVLSSATNVISNVITCYPMHCARTFYPTRNELINAKIVLSNGKRCYSMPEMGCTTQQTGYLTRKTCREKFVLRKKYDLGD